MSNSSVRKAEHERDDRRAERARAEMTLSCNIERDYGDVKISYGLSGVYSITDMTDMNAAYEELRLAVETQHELAQQNRPAMIPAKLKAQLASGQSVILCSQVRKESVEGKLRIRLLGGEFQTHGIACYPEYFEELDIWPDRLEWGDNPYGHHVLVQLKPDGTPKRAVSIVEET